MLSILGAKLRIERENLGLTQEYLARALGLSSEFISLLELGKRKPSLESLRAITDYFKKDIAYFLKEREMAFERLMQHKTLSQKDKKALNKFKKYCDDYLWLEEVLERRLELAPAYSHVDPERLALEERRRLGLGDAPIRDMFLLAELNGLRIFRQALDRESAISGVFMYYDVKEAAFALINSCQTLGDQVFTVAHEYYHFLRDRHTDPIIDNQDIFVEDYISLYHPREKFAQLFARHFLMPPTKVRAAIEKDLRSNKLKYEDVIYLKRYFGVSMPAMLQTLRDLDYISFSKMKEFQNLDHTTYEKTLFGRHVWSDYAPKGKTIPSDRFKSLAVIASTEKRTKPSL